MTRASSEAMQAVNTQGVLRAQPVSEDSDFLVIVQPAKEDVDLASWACANRALIHELLLQRCGILFRGFEVQTVTDFEAVVGAGDEGELVTYTGGSTPRYAIPGSASGKIYTTTVYPADQVIPFHPEVAYATTWPMRLWLCCHQPAAEGGETPLCDSRRVYQRIDPAIREEFTRKKVMYVRNFGEIIDVPWQKAFLTEDRSEVERRCRAERIEFEWLEGGGLRTRKVSQGVTTHPQTGERVWFNQAHLFHVSSLPARRRQALEKLFAESDLPRNAYFGDGSPIDESMLGNIRDAYRKEKVMFPWQRTDVAVVDNVLAAHAREPFKGERMIWIAMTEEYTPV